MTASDKPLMTWEEAVIWLRQQPDKAQLVRDCFYDDPLTEAAERYYKSTEWQAVRKLVGPPNGKALDIGAGRGISSYALARDGWETVALEPDKSSVVGAVAIKKLSKSAELNIFVVEEWGEKLPFEDQSFELVYCRQVLHHARDLSQLCREIRRVLKHKGMLLATREHVISRKRDLMTFLDSHPLQKFYGGEYAYTLKEYRSAIVGGGLTMMKILRPYDSDINLFPSSKDELEASISAKYGFARPTFLFKLVLAILNIRNNIPGRLYSFVGYKE